MQSFLQDIKSVSLEFQNHCSPVRTMPMNQTLFHGAGLHKVNYRGQSCRRPHVSPLGSGESYPVLSVHEYDRCHLQIKNVCSIMRFKYTWRRSIPRTSKSMEDVLACFFYLEPPMHTWPVQHISITCSEWFLERCKKGIKIPYPQRKSLDIKMKGCKNKKDSFLRCSSLFCSQTPSSVFFHANPSASSLRSRYRFALFAYIPSDKMTPCKNTPLTRK